MSFFMLTSRNLIEILSQANDGDFEDTMIISKAGKLIAYHGSNEANMDVLTVIASNIWTLYEDSGLKGLKEDELHFVMLDYSDGKIAIMKVENFLLCLRTKSEVQLGFLQTKAKMLADCLQHPLKQVNDSNYR